MAKTKYMHGSALIPKNKKIFNLDTGLVSPLYIGNGYFYNSENPNEMPYAAAFHQGLHHYGEKNFRQKKQLFF